MFIHMLFSSYLQAAGLRAIQLLNLDYADTPLHNIPAAAHLTLVDAGVEGMRILFRVFPEGEFDDNGCISFIAHRSTVRIFSQPS